MYEDTHMDDNGQAEGKRGLFAYFDQERQLRFTLGAMEWLEQAVEQGRVVSCELITQQLWRSQYLKAALRASLGMDPTTKGPIVKEEDLEHLYEAYIEKSGDRTDLENLVRDAYRMATKNPTKLTKKEVTQDLGGEQSPT